MFTQQTYRGFSLVELLVAIAIIGILSSVVFVSLSGTRAGTRDKERITVVHQVELAAQLFKSACGVEPTSVTSTCDTTTPDTEMAKLIGNTDASAVVIDTGANTICIDLELDTTDYCVAL